MHPTPVGPPPPRTSTPTFVPSGAPGQRHTPEYSYLPAHAPAAATSATTPTRTTHEITGTSATGPMKTLLENLPKQLVHKPSLMDIPEDVPQDSTTTTTSTPAATVTTAAGTPTNIIPIIDTPAVVITTSTTTPTTAASQASTQSSDSSQAPLVIDERAPPSPKK